MPLDKTTECKRSNAIFTRPFAIYESEALWDLLLQRQDGPWPLPKPMRTATRRWSFGQLERCNHLQAASIEAAKSDLILIAMQDGHALPSSVAHWMGMTLALRESRDFSLMLIVAQPSVAAPVCSYFNELSSLFGFQCLTPGCACTHAGAEGLECVAAGV